MQGHKLSSIYGTDLVPTESVYVNYYGDQQHSCSHFAPFWRYDDLQAENRQPFLSPLIFNTLTRNKPFWISQWTILYWVLGLSISTNLVIPSWVILTKYQYVTDRKTDRYLNNSQYSILHTKPRRCNLNGIIAIITVRMILYSAESCSVMSHSVHRDVVVYLQYSISALKSTESRWSMAVSFRQVYDAIHNNLQHKHTLRQ